MGICAYNVLDVITLVYIINLLRILYFQMTPVIIRIYTRGAMVRKLILSTVIRYKHIFDIRIRSKPRPEVMLLCAIANSSLYRVSLLWDPQYKESRARKNKHITAIG